MADVNDLLCAERHAEWGRDLVHQTARGNFLTETLERHVHRVDPALEFQFGAAWSRRSAPIRWVRRRLIPSHALACWASAPLVDASNLFETAVRRAGKHWSRRAITRKGRGTSGIKTKSGVS